MSPRHVDPRVEKATSASVSDALDELFGHKSYVRDLISPTPGRVLFGPASTVRFVPVREDAFNPAVHSFERLFYEAVEQPREGQVLVVDASGHFDTALLGGVQAERLDANRVAGVLADCRLRGFETFAEMDLAAWCRGNAPKQGAGKLMGVAANVPAVVGDTTVIPGDWVLADRGGAVVIPEEHLEDVLDRAVEIEEERREAGKRARKEDPEETLSREP